MNYVTLPNHINRSASAYLAVGLPELERGQALSGARRWDGLDAGLIARQSGTSPVRVRGVALGESPQSGQDFSLHRVAPVSRAKRMQVGRGRSASGCKARIYGPVAASIAAPCEARVASGYASPREGKLGCASRGLFIINNPSPTDNLYRKAA